MNKENKIVLGILFMTFAMFCLSVNDVLVKGLSKAYPIWEVIFFRANNLFYHFCIDNFFWLENS